jgi:hypothetical protein
LPLLLLQLPPEGTYIFVKEGGGGAVEEAGKALAIPPPGPLMLIIHVLFEQGELCRGLGGRRKADEPRAVELNEKIGFFFPRSMAG